MICVCVILQQINLPEVVAALLFGLFDLFGSVWPIAATTTPWSSRLRFGLLASKKRFYSATLAFTVVLVNSRVEL